MIKSLTVYNPSGDNIELELRKPEKSGFLIKSISGLGPNKANIHTSEISTADGTVYNSARLSQRNIVLDLIFVESVKSGSIEDIRQKSYKFFPIKKEIKIKIETDNRTIATNGFVEANEPNIFSKQEGTQVSIICPYPYLFSEEDSSTIFNGVEPVFEFPFSNESLIDPKIVFGDIQNKTENVINYRGDAEVGIIIKIHAIGEAGDIMIYNTGTREQMKIDTSKLQSLTGSGIIAGDDIVINSQVGEKSITLIRDGKETNILNCLEKGSDWFSLKKGDNIFAYTSEDGTTNLQFQIDNKILYEGV